MRPSLLHSDRLDRDEHPIFDERPGRNPRGQGGQVALTIGPSAMVAGLVLCSLAGCVQEPWSLDPGEWQDTGCISQNAPAMQGWLRSEPELNEFWQMYCQEYPGPPKVNFERHTALYFFNGPPPQGWDIRIDAITDGAPPLVVLTRVDRTNCPNFSVEIAGRLFLVRRMDEKPIFNVTEEVACRI